MVLMASETIKYALTLSGSAYTQVEKQLQSEIGNKRKGRRGSSTKVMLIEAIEIEWWHETAARADGDSQMLQITTNSESAEVYISDKDCFFKAKRMYEGVVLQMNELIVRYLVNRPYIKKVSLDKPLNIFSLSSSLLSGKVAVYSTQPLKLCGLELTLWVLMRQTLKFMYQLTLTTSILMTGFYNESLQRRCKSCRDVGSVVGILEQTSVWGHMCNLLMDGIEDVEDRIIGALDDAIKFVFLTSLLFEFLNNFIFLLYFMVINFSQVYYVKKV